MLFFSIIVFIRADDHLRRERKKVLKKGEMRGPFPGIYILAVIPILYFKNFEPAGRWLLRLLLKAKELLLHARGKMGLLLPIYEGRFSSVDPPAAC